MIRHSALCSAVFLITFWSCSHPQTATDRPKTEEESPPQRESKRPKATSGDKSRNTRGTRSDAEFPLATSPAGLLKPGAAGDIQKALVERGHLASSSSSGELDAATQKALREFQEENHLPATGTPDDLTVRKLGLDVSKVFRTGP